MNIANTIAEELSKHQRKYEYDLCVLQSFLTEPRPFLERRECAKDIIGRIIAPHSKDYLMAYVSRMAEVEYANQEIMITLRDHVVHAVLTFALGVYVNERFMGPILNGRCHGFQWKIAGLFHDIGYPIEIAQRGLVTSYLDTVNSIRQEIGLSGRKIVQCNRLNELEGLTDGRNSLDLVQECLRSWKLQIDAKAVYEQMIDSGRTCHGMLSGLTLLNIIDVLYKANNPEREHRRTNGGGADWDQTIFDEHIVPACSAIFIHHLDPKHFEKSKIDARIAPAAFLLKLADTLQEWERPSRDHPGYAADKFGIEVDNGVLIVRADMPAEKNQEMNDTIQATLVAPAVHVR